jgi:lipopolysaccharide exporter
LAQAQKNGTLPFLIEETINRLIAFSFFPLLVFSFIGSDLFIVVFGQKWAEAGVYTQILSIWTIFWFISSPISNVFSIAEKQEQGLRINLLIFVTRLASLWIGGLIGQPRISIMLFSITGVFVYGYMCYAVLKISEVSVKKVLLIQWKYFRLSIPVGLGLGVMKFFSVTGWIQLSFAALTTIIYYFFVIRDDEQMLGTINKLLLKFKIKLKI